MYSGRTWVGGALEQGDEEVAMFFTLAVPGRRALLQ